MKKYYKMLSEFTQIVKEFDFIRNVGLDPEHISHGSKKKLWWQCLKNKGHIWQARVGDRTIRNSGCPFCRGLKVLKEESFGFKFPELATEWHPVKNGDLSPFDVSPCSAKEAWWLCRKNRQHEWRAQVSNRSSNHTGCPYCTGSLVEPDGSNSFGKLYPCLLDEWLSEKNMDLDPFGILPKSMKKAWWCCKLHSRHIWLAPVSARTSGRGCPYCAGFKVLISESFGSLYTDIAREWHLTKNGYSCPFDFSPKSGVKVWWQCMRDPGHEWQSTILNRVVAESGCPYCYNNRWKGELRVKAFLNNQELDFQTQWSSDKCKNKNKLRFDFGVLVHNKTYLIEYNGIGHYEPVGFGGDPNIAFRSVKKNDAIKREFCKDYKVPLLVIPYWDIDKTDELVKNFLGLKD